MRAQKIIRYFSVGLVVFIFCAMSSMRIISYFLNKNHLYIENYIQTAFHHSVKIQQVRFHWHFFKPTLYLSGVSIQNKNTISSLNINELSITMGFWKSLFYRTLVADSVELNEANFFLNEQIKNQWQLNGFSFLENSQSDLGWDILPSHFLLKKIRLTIKTLKGQTAVIYVGMAKINLSLNSTSIKLKLNSENSIFQLDSLFLQPIFLSVLKGNFLIKKNKANLLEMSVKKMQLSNSVLHAKVDFKVNQLANQTLPEIDLAGQFNLGNAKQVIHYLPMHFFQKSLADWLNAAFLNGYITNGFVKLRGPLSNFPFDDKKGEFSIGGDVHDLNLHFANHWPDIYQMNGKLLFSDSRMNAAVSSGLINGAEIHDVEVVIPKINDEKVQLQVTGKIKGNLSQTAYFIRNSPLKNNLFPYFFLLNPSGNIKLDLHLLVPLKQLNDLTVLGRAYLLDDSMHLSRFNLITHHLNGNLSFSEKGLQSFDAKGLLWNQPISIEIKKNPQSILSAFIQGKISSDQLQTHFNLPLQNILQGSTSYTVKFNLPNNPKNLNLHIESNLIGMKINFYHFYQKPMLDKLKTVLNLDYSLTSNSLKTHLIFEDLHNKGLFAGRTVIEVPTIETGIQLFIKNNQIQGKISSLNKKLFKSWQVKLDYLYLTAEEKSATDLHGIDPKNLPLIDFQTKQFWYNKQFFGGLHFILEPTVFGVNIKQFLLDSSLGQLKMSGNWLKQRTSLNGILTTHHLAQVLNKITTVSNLEAEFGQIQFNINWSNVPWKINLNHLNGKVSVKVKKGRILNLSTSTNTQMGMGRLLNIFSLQSIPRRLSLDFSDLFEKGFNFDRASGDFVFQSGNAFTQNFKMDGALARIHAEGRIGLIQKDYDIHLNVTPQVTGSLPVVAAIATANPIAGIATWFVEKAMHRQVSSLVTHHYLVKGSWENPTWQKVE